MEAFPGAILWMDFALSCALPWRNKGWCYKIQQVQSAAYEASKRYHFCQLELLYVDHKYFQTYFYSINPCSGSWRRKRLYLLVHIHWHPFWRCYNACRVASLVGGGGSTATSSSLENGKGKGSAHCGTPQGFHILRHFLLNLNLMHFFNLFC